MERLYSKQREYAIQKHSEIGTSGKLHINGMPKCKLCLEEGCQQKNISKGEIIEDFASLLKSLDSIQNNGEQLSSLREGPA